MFKQFSAIWTQVIRVAQYYFNPLSYLSGSYAFFLKYEAFWKEEIIKVSEAKILETSYLIVLMNMIVMKPMLLFKFRFSAIVTIDIGLVQGNCG